MKMFLFNLSCLTPGSDDRDKFQMIIENEKIQETLKIIDGLKMDLFYNKNIYAASDTQLKIYVWSEDIFMVGDVQLLMRSYKTSEKSSFDSWSDVESVP